MMFARGVVAVAIVFLPFGTVQCGGPGEPEPGESAPSVILFTIDTLRADHVSAYGYHRSTTPNFDELARSGTLFERAISTASYTVPSHASMLTGRFPFQHQARQVLLGAPPSDEAFNTAEFCTDLPLAGAAITLAERFSAVGYPTAAFVSAFVLTADFSGLRRGFDHYDDGFEGRERRSEETVDRALAWLRDVSPPFFLWVHLYDPHTPYEPPPTHTIETDTREERDVEIALYDGEISHADFQMGRLFAALKKRGGWSNAVVAVTSDHGEAFGEHELWYDHGPNVYQELLRVPLTVRHPRETARVVSNPVSLVDLAPTLADLAGLPLEDEESRRSLGAYVRGRSDPSTSPIHAESDATNYRESDGRRYSLQQGTWKLISSRDGKEAELYHLATDALEQENAAERLPGRVGEMTQRLRRLMSTGPIFPAAPRRRLSREVIEKLRGLGYVR